MRFCLEVSQSNANYLTENLPCAFANMGVQVLICESEGTTARTSSKMGMQNITDKFHPHITPIAEHATARQPGADINTIMRWGIIREYCKLLCEGSSLPPGGLESL